MAYTLNFVADMGNLTGLTLNAQLYDASGAATGAAITSGFVEVVPGKYSLLATIPNQHVGTFTIYDTGDPYRIVPFSINPAEYEIASDVENSLVANNTSVTVASPVSSAGTLTIIRYVTFSATISGLTIPSDWAAVYLTMKSDVSDIDTGASLQILKSNPSGGGDGLLRLNGAAATLSQASLTVNQAGGTVGIDIMDDVTGLISTQSSLSYDIKALRSGSRSQLITNGSVLISWTATRAI